MNLEHIVFVVLLGVDLLLSEPVPRLLQLPANLEVCLPAPGVDPPALPGPGAPAHSRCQLELGPVRGHVDVGGLPTEGGGNGVLQLLPGLAGQGRGQADKGLEAVVGVLDAGLKKY